MGWFKGCAGVGVGEEAKVGVEIGCSLLGCETGREGEKSKKLELSRV